MPALAPLKIVFYDPETQEERREYICNHVPMRYLKLALQLSMSKANINMDILAGLIVDLFGRQFSVDELREYTETQNRLILLQALIRRPGFFMVQKTDKKENELPANNELSDLEEDIIDMEISLINVFGWSMYDIDETDIESLFPFMNLFVGGHKKPVKSNRIYAEQMQWF